jgi:H+-transporting ATPase
LVNLVVSGQAVYYVVRERRRIWSSRPSMTVLVCSLADLLIVPSLAGFLMASLALSFILGIAGAGVLFALALDGVKVRVFAVLNMR